MTHVAADRAGRRGEQVLGTLARVGYAVNGLLHALIGVLAISIAVGSGGEADQAGALAALAAAPGGRVLLWVLVVGLIALGVWQVVETVRASGSSTGEVWKARAREAGKAIAYLAVGGTALRFALRGSGSSSSGEQQADSASASVLALPFGPVLLLAVGAGIAAIGVFFAIKGARRDFLEQIRVPSGAAGTATTALGTIGYIAKGVSLVTIGVLVGIAALTTDPQQAAGLDGALKTLAGLAPGQAALIAIGLGFLAFGAYCVVRAVRARL